MARIRSIHPDACKSRKLSAVSAEAERCFWRLQVHCDDTGRAEDDPELLTSQLFAMDRNVTQDDVDGWLFELAQVGLIVRYGDETEPTLEVLKFKQYQKPRHPQPSQFPEPPDQGIPAFRRNGTAECGNAPAGVEWSGVEEEGLNRNTRRLASADRRRILSLTASIVADRRLLHLHAKTKRDPDRWLAAAIRGISDDIADELNSLLTDAPNATPEQLADYFQAVESIEGPRVAITSCDECGWEQTTAQYPHGTVHAEWLAEGAS